MKKINRVLSWILVITMLVGVCPAWATGLSGVGNLEDEGALRGLLAERPENDVQTMALTETVSGNCGAEGDNLTWTLTTDGTLTISGKGNMAQYSISYSSYQPPWYNYRDSITALVIGNGVTSIGNEAFANCTNLTDAVIPDSVAKLGYSVFSYCSSLKSVVIGDSVTEIKNNTFDSCTSLERVEIGAGIVDINFDRLSSSIFYGCTGLKEIVVDENCAVISSIDGVLFDKSGETLLLYPAARPADTYTVPASVKTIKERAFEQCAALKNIVIPDTVETIEYGAFMNAALENASIGATTTERNAFYGCSVLKTVTFTSGAENIASAFSRSGLTEVTIPSSVQSIDESFIYCESLKKVVVDCETISSGAFSYCTSLTDLTIGENVRTIGSYAFCDTGLSELTIPGTVSIIDSNAFWKCTALKKLVIEDGVMSLGGTAFQDCTALEQVTLPGSITDVGDSVFFNCTALEVVTLKNGFTIIGSGMFTDCVALHTISIPITLTTIGDRAFEDCTNLTTVNYPGTKAQWMAISIAEDNDLLWAAIGYEDPGPNTGCGDGTITPTGKCPDFTLTTLDGETITQDSFGESTKLIIFYRTTCPNSQTVIRALANSALTDNYDLKIIAVEIDGASESMISDFARAYGNNGKNIIFCIDGYTYSGAFRQASGNSGTTLPFLYVVKNGAITSHSSGYVTITQIEEMLLKMPDIPEEPDEPEIPDEPVVSGTCGDNLTWELANGVLTIRGEGEMTSDDWYTPWFDYCYDVFSIVIEEGVTSIEPLAFQGFIYLTEVSLPSSLTSIGYFAFVDCTALAEINFPDGLKSIGYSAFEACNSLVSVSLPDSVTTMGSRVFAECMALTDIKLPAGIKEIPVEALIACTALATITIPEGVTAIGNYAFLDCKNLTSVTIGKNVTKIGFQTFDRCTSLATVYYAGTEEQWNAIKISNYNDPLKNAKIFYESTHVHTSESIPGVPAKCEETGLSEGAKCTECGEIIVPQKEIPALGHDYDDGTDEVKPSCEASGLVRYTCMREGCGDSYTKETPAHGHKEEKIPAKQPTMTETGLTPGVKCAICDKILVAQEEVAPVAPEATDIISETILGELQSGMNRETLYYSIGSPARWDNPIGSYLFENADGTISILRSWTLEGEDDYGLRVYTYSNSLELLETKFIPWELPLFGGFYAGEEYNYIVFGQENWEEDDTKEVIRLVKYDKDFNRVGSIAVCDAYTCVPFDAGSLRMAENGSELIVHTSRTRYLTVDDGLHHQSQLTIYFDTESMTVTADNLGAFQGNHVGHSFNQFVIYDGDDAVLLDHGDAYPRSIVLHKETVEWYGQQYTSIDLFGIPGPEGANCTGVSIGDFTQSETTYLAAINTIDHSLATGYDSFDIFFVDGVEYEERDVVLLVVDKETLKTEQVYLTDYVGTGKTVSAPKMLSLGKDRFLVLWSVFTLEPSEHIYYEPSEYGVSFVVVDGNGNRLTPIKHQSGAHLLDGQPIMWNGMVTWFVDNTVDIFSSNATRILYQIDLDELLGDAAHTPEVIPGYDPTCTRSGRTDGQKCVDCGKILVEQQEIPALGHVFDEGVVTKEPTCTEKGERTCACRRCGEQGVEEIPITEHTEEVVTGREPTLTEPGLTDGGKCSVCGKILLEQEEIPVLESVTGSCGDTLTWTLTPEGTLTISGTGEMFDFKSAEDLQPQSVAPMSEMDTEVAPWSDYTGLITKVVIEEGVTRIGDNAFAACEKLTEVKIPETVTEIGDDVFSGCEALETVTYTGSEDQWNEVKIGEGNEALNGRLAISSVLMGDVTGDGVVDVGDAVKLLKAIASKTTDEFSSDVFTAADVTRDGTIDVGDAVKLLKAIASKTTDEL